MKGYHRRLKKVSLDNQYLGEFMLKVMTIFGTRPEAIKMVPVIKAVERHSHLESVTVVTGQHRGMLDQVLSIFEIVVDHDLDIMQVGQSLSDITTKVLVGLKPVIEQERPGIILVHGDTTTAFVSALAGFYAKVPIGHVEAGLRTYQRYSPFPEEMNRNLVSKISTLHFAPTTRAKSNLMKENVAGTICVTGNTVVDTLYEILDKITPAKERDQGKLVLVTVHRRENHGEPLSRIFRALKTFAEEFPEFRIIYPVHPNPLVKSCAESMLGSISNIELSAPLDYIDLVKTMSGAQFVVTDSGGIQEEAPALGKPVIVLRETTERPEVIEAGAGRLVGSNPERILEIMRNLVDYSSDTYKEMSSCRNLYGDGSAGEQIANAIFQEIVLSEESPFGNTLRDGSNRLEVS